MKIKTYSIIALSFLLINANVVAADTITVGNSGNENYTSIQQAVNNSVDGDTILVNKGTYIENVDIDKKLAVISKSGNPEDTIIQAFHPYDHVLHVTANNVTIKGFGLRNSSSTSGIYLDNVQYNTIANNHLQANGIGIHLWNAARNNILINNTASDNNWAGIRLTPDDSELASNNTLINNTMVNNTYNFEIYTGYENASMQNNIDITNTVNGKPIYYLVNVSNITLNSTSNAGAIYCINCQNMTIKDQVLQNNSLSIALFNTSNSRFNSNILSNNIYGIFLDNSNNNSGLNNIAINNGIGIVISSSTNNNLSNNVANSNGNGFDILDSDNTELNNNTANNNKANGIALSSSTKNQLSGNIANYNLYGITFYNCSDNLLNNNIANSNEYAGIDLGGSNNTLINNIANSNRRYDFEFARSNNNTLRGNIGNSDVDHLPVDSSNRTSKNEIKDQDIENKSFISSLISAVFSWV
jgi:parallel beta-helix repeat protein